jgi:dipeptidyl aminopeptidase/acylaminoacyl peptidase
MKETLAYGLWPSPITPASLAYQVRLQDVAWDTQGATLVWVEGRSDRGVLVCATAEEGAPRDLTTDLSVRARVGYGGGDTSAAHGQAYFVSGGRLYRQALTHGPARTITPAFGEAAAPRVSPDGRWVAFIHSYEERDCVALVDVEGRYWPQKLHEGHDFCMQVAWHPDSQRVAWIAWDHPLMPWDGAQLYLGELALHDGNLPILARSEVIAGSEECAVQQPAFSPDGRYLAYISDATGWPNLYLYNLESGAHRPLVTGEFDLGVTAWRQDMRTYGWSPDGRSIYYAQTAQGFGQLRRVTVETGAQTSIAALEGYSAISQISVSPQGSVAALASSPTTPERVLTYDPDSAQVRVWAHSGHETLAPEVLSRPEPVAWPTTEGDQAYGLLYRPVEEHFEGIGKPPAIVMVHGGPTGQTAARFAADVQFLTTRGYVVLAVNYRGSSGYGRAYQDALRERWGIYDVDDAVSGARFLADTGCADPDRIVIMGGSAGGYTVLQALINHPGVFKAGVCLYGVTNLFSLASDTHKFEQHYLDSLIGPLPETAQRYRERSPIFFADRIADPVAIFQGEDDRVVPPNQAETIVAALRRKGVPHEYYLYPGEGHGWRKTETIDAFYTTLLRFLKQYVLLA